MLDPEIIEKMKVLAEKDNRSLSKYINSLLKLHVAAMEERGGAI